MSIHEVCATHLEYQEAVVLRHLMDRGAATKDQLVDAVWGHREDGGPLTAAKRIDQYVYRVRRRLKPGWRIEYMGHGCWLLRSVS